MTKSNAFLVMTFGEYIDIKRKGRATQLYKPEVAVGKKKTSKKSQPFKESEEDDEDYSNEDDDEEEENKQKQKKQKRGNETYLEYLDTGNLKNMPNKTKKPNLLPDDNDEPIELSPTTYTVVKPTVSPVKVKNEKMGNEVKITKKEQKQEKDDFERIRQEIGVQIGAQIGAQLEAQFGEFMKLYMKLPMEMKVTAEQPQQEKKDENENDKTKN
jgi:hypothetical protein